MTKQKGFSLIGVLIIIGTLILTAGGVVVWERKSSLTPSPTPSATSAPKPTQVLPPLSKTPRIPSEPPPKTEDVSQFCGLREKPYLSFPVIRIEKCGSLYRLIRQCCDATDKILDENFNFVAECGGFASYSEECAKLVFSHKCIEVVKCKL